MVAASPPPANEQVIGSKIDQHLLAFGVVLLVVFKQHKTNTEFPPFASTVHCAQPLPGWAAITQVIAMHLPRKHVGNGPLPIPVPAPMSKNPGTP